MSNPRLRDPLPPSEEDSLDPRRLIWILFRRRWQILLVSVLVVVPAAVATFLAQPLYRSTTLIEVSPEQVQVSPYRDIVPGAGNYLEYMTTQEQVLRGAVLHGRVVKRLMAEPEGSALRDEIPRLGGVAIQQIENSQVFRITYLAPRPDIAAMVANTYAEEYIKGHFEGRQQTREKAGSAGSQSAAR